MTHQEWLADRKQRAIEYLDRGNRQKAVGFTMAETKVTPDFFARLDRCNDRHARNNRGSKGIHSRFQMTARSVSARGADAPTDN